MRNYALVILIIFGGCVSQTPPEPLTCSFQPFEPKECFDLKIGDRLDCDSKQLFVTDVYYRNFGNTNTNQTIVLDSTLEVACTRDQVEFSGTEISWGKYACQVERCR